MSMATGRAVKALFLGLLVPALLAGGLWIARSRPEGRSGTEIRTSSAVLEIRSGDLKYTYHVVSGTEGLFDLSRDPGMLTNQVRASWREGLLLRRRLERSLGVASLSETRPTGERDYEIMRGHGYVR
jgi:hypothetical protein